MAKKEWGLLCPQGHGLLVQRDEWHKRGVAWCPHSDHGGNGRFWRLNEAEEGWFDPTRPIEPTEAQKERERLAMERNAAFTAYLEEKKAKATRMAKEKKEAAPKAVKPPQDCLCGCGGQTKGGRFLPGHDARYHARIKSLEAQGVDHAQAEKIASKGPLTGKYAAKPAAAKPAAAPKPPRAAKPKQPDLTARASDEPAVETTVEPEGNVVDVTGSATAGGDFEV